MPDDVQEGRWLSLRDAAPALGLERDTLRKQLARGERQGRRDNRGRWLVLMPAHTSMAARTVPGSVREASRIDAGTGTDDAGKAAPDVTARLAERDVRIARLEERLAAAEEIRAELRRQVEELRERLAREDERRDAAERRQAEQDARLGDVLRELRAKRQHRPWPGLRRWWRRVIEGEEG